MPTGDLAKVEVGTGVDELTKLLGNLNFGTGKATTITDAGTKTTSGGTTTAVKAPSTKADEDATALLDDLKKDSDTTTIDAIIDNIYLKAKEKFGDSISNAKSAGVRAYSDSTLDYLRDSAIAKATGEAASAKLKAKTDTNKIAADLVPTQNN